VFVCGSIIWFTSSYKFSCKFKKNFVHRNVVNTTSWHEHWTHEICKDFFFSLLSFTLNYR
jgi:hypothetical protein